MTVSGTCQPLPPRLPRRTWEDIVPYFDDLAERPLDADHDRGLAADVVPAGGAGHRGRGAGDDRLHHRHLAIRRRRADHLRFSTEILPEDGGAERRAGPAARGAGLQHARARHHAGPVPHLDRDLPRGERPHLLGAGGAERALPADHRVDDRRVGGRGAPAAAAPAVPQEPRPGGAGARLPRRHAALHRGARRTWPRCSTGCIELRQQAARNAGFANFRDYIFPAKFRFDYTPADCERFHEAVERDGRAGGASGCSSIGGSGSGWTCSGRGTWRWIPTARTPLRPFATVDEFVGTAQRGLRPGAIPSLGGEFQTMIDERLLDLDSRKGKAPGGYCETLHFRGRPFIFMNAVGLVDDVMTLLHEAGHAFHAFASHRAAAHLAAASRLRGRGAGLHVDGAAGGAASGRSRSGYFTPRGSPQRLARAPGGRAAEPGAHRLGGCVPDLDLHQRRGRRCRGPRRRLAPDPEPLRARGGLERTGAASGWPAGTASSTSSCTRSTTSSTASPRSARSRSGATASRTPPQAVARYREALALGAVAASAGDVPRRGRRAHLRRRAHRRAGGAGRGARSSRLRASCQPRRPPQRGCFPAAGSGKILARASRRPAPASCRHLQGEPGWPKKKGSRWRGW